MRNLKRTVITTATIATLTLTVGLAACTTNKHDAKPAAAAASALPSESPNAKESKGPKDPKEKTLESSSSPAKLHELATSKRPARNVPVPGPLPKVAKQKNKVGRAAFVDHWLKEVNYAWQVGSFRKEFWDITSPKCQYCKAVDKVFSRMKERKAWVVGGEIRFENVHIPNEKLENGNYYVTFTMHEDERSYYEPGKTKPVETVEGGWVDGTALVLERKEDGWRMRGFYAIDDVPQGK